MTPEEEPHGRMVPSRAFRTPRYAESWGRREIEYLLREQAGQIVDDIPHGYNTGLATLIIDQGDVPIAADTHLVEGIDEFIVYAQAFRIGGHELINAPAININLLCCHFGENVPFGEHSHQAILVDNQYATYPFTLHYLNGLTHGRARLTRDSRLKG